MKRISLFILLFVFVCVLAGSKTTQKFGSHEKQQESIYTLQNLLIDRHNLAVDDLDTLYNYNTGVLSDSIYKLRGKFQRLRPDTVIATYINATLYDTIHATYGNFTLFDTIRATRGDFSSFDTANVIYVNATLFDTVNATYGNFTLFDTLRSVYYDVDYGVVDSAKIGSSGSVFTTVKITDAAADTLEITTGGKTWKFVPVADQ